MSSRPSNLTEPDVGLCSCRIARPVVDLPQPDSPTTPSVSPASRCSETPLTACTCPTRAPDQAAALDREVLDEVAHLEQRGRRRRSRRRASGTSCGLAATVSLTPSPPSHGRWSLGSGRSARTPQRRQAARVAAQVGLVQLGLDGLAPVLDERAARRERAAGRQVDERRRGPRDRPQPPALAVQRRDRPEQAGRVRHPGLHEHFAGSRRARPTGPRTSPGRGRRARRPRRGRA